jgi:hypothetical protein
MTLAFRGDDILLSDLERRKDMKKAQCALHLVLLSVLAVIGRTPSATAGTAQELMTKGKLAADLGDQHGAEQAFARLAADAGAPESARAEALVRLGVVQRALGKAQASAAAFEKAMQSPGRDAQVTRLLTLAVAGVAPDRTRWASQWAKVRLASLSRTSDPRPVIQWPGPGPLGVREAFPVTDLVSFDLEDVSLTAFLYKLLTGNPPGPPMIPPGFANWPRSYQPPAPVQRLEFAIAAGALPDPRVTVKASSMPWNELFENVLASNGLGFILDKNLLFVARVENLGDIERVRGRVYESGNPVGWTIICATLTDLFHILSDVTGLQLVPDRGVNWMFAPPDGIHPATNVNWLFALRISEQPALQALDLILAANGLAATRIAPPADTKPGTTALRISRLADVRGETVDLSKLAPAPSSNP